MRLQAHIISFLFIIASIPNLCAEQTSASNASKLGTQLTEVSPVLLISTLNGQLSAVEKNTGAILWSRQEHPVLKVPSNSASSVFLPNPKDGSLYIVVSTENANSGEPRQPSIKKLPFTIPELVSASPCRSSDGMLYTGQKLDVWLAIDLATGEKKETISFYGSDNLCPQSKSGLAYIGRSEYHLAMFDVVSKEKRWNATYYDYASTAANVPEVAVADYDLVHFASSEVGKIISFDKSSGEFLWEADFSSPIVALYLVDDSPDSQPTLFRLPFTSLAQRTIDDIGTRLLRKNWKKYMSSNLDDSPLFPALYIGLDSSRQELYALPSFVDKTVPLIPADGNARNIPLLEGPKSKAGRRREIYEGYYELPEPVLTSLTPRRQITGGSEMFAPDEGSVIEIPPKKGDASSQTEETHAGGLSPEALFQQKIAAQLYWIKLSLATLLTIVIATGLWLYFQARKYQSSSRVMNLRISGETGLPVRELEISETGICTVGKISYDANDKLGSGGNGTVVFRGQFDGRPVAVKRILPVCFSLAYREVKLLRETDEHPNVVRYFCMEEDPHFYYIALELCGATLTEFVENPNFERGNLNPLKAIHQAACGLEHLHNLNIAHRDVKPQNVLISRASNSGLLKVMISDFGLCKELTHGDRSFSKKSGVLGTEGWIAPEVLDGTESGRVTKAIDIFSLGCVFHYALSGGYHPFGDSFERQANIRKGKINLANLDARYITAKGLIHQMLQADGRHRPTAAQVTRHPSFWDSSTTLNFIQEVSDRIEKEPHNSPVVRQLEKNGFKILNNRNWLEQITGELQKDLKRFRSYKGTCVRDLLRAIRNKKHHYRELPPELREELGTIPDEYIAYFATRFPYLILHTYSAMQRFRHDAPLLKTYYAPDDFLIELNQHPDLDLMTTQENSWEIWRSNRMQKQLERTAADEMLSACLPEEDALQADMDDSLNENGNNERSENMPPASQQPSQQQQQQTAPSGTPPETFVMIPPKKKKHKKNKGPL